MKRTRISIPISILHRYETYHFGIAVSLAGASHSFTFEGLDVIIRLPAKPSQKDWMSDSSPITCSSYRQRSGRKYPSYYAVHQVDALLKTNRKRAVPAHAIGRANVNLFTRAAQRELDELAQKFAPVLNRAFEYWIDTIRWKSAEPTICQREHRRQATRWGTYLVESVTEQRFYAPPFVITLDRIPVISMRQWYAAETALRQRTPVPVWQFCVADAGQRLQLRDSRRFILELAIAAETMVRRLMKRYVPLHGSPAFEDCVDGISIGRILDSWKKMGFKSAGWTRLVDAKVVAKVKEVVNLRNAIMHRGERPRVSRERCIELQAAVVAFIRQGESEIVVSLQTTT